MRITAISYIGNEEDIVEAFVRHTLGFADAMIIVSTVDDTTRTILHTLEQEGLPLTIIDHQPSYYDQEHMMTRLLHRHRKEADWFLFLDADEFVTGDLRASLTCAPREALALGWKTYVPMPDDDVSEPIVHRRIRNRRTQEIPQFTKIVVPADSVTWRTHIAPGNHAVIQGKRCDNGTLLEDVTIAHFPIRSAAQLIAKIERGWPGVERKPHRMPGEAFHWESMHANYAGTTPDADTLTAIALRYSLPADAPDPSVTEDPILC